MRKLAIISFLYICTLNAQKLEFTGSVLDATTNAPIEFVNIYIDKDSKNNTTGAISNELGQFAIVSKERKVIFSHINYAPLMVTLKETFNEIKLKPKEFVLDEVVISTLPVKEYLEKIIEGASDKLTKNTVFKTYCREFVKIDDAYTKFSDGLVAYYVKKGNGKSKIILKESRAFDNKNEEEEDDIGIHTINTVFKLKNYVRNAYNFKILQKIVKNENYEFERKLKGDAMGKEYEFIKIIPNKESKDLLYEGYIVIDNASKNILEFRIQTSKAHANNGKLRNFLVAKAKFKNHIRWSKFKITDGNYILTYNKEQMEIFVKVGKRVSSDFNFNSDLFVYEFAENVEIPRKGYNKKTIYQAGTNYKHEFWKTYNAFPLTQAQQKFITTARKKE